ncbi:MAG: leucine-rich repeat protein [Bacteroidales bacterium]|nr:leucine-rich repeat protein [Bacteroidales bacterium]
MTDSFAFFDEFVYFKGIEEIEQGQFQNWEQLESIRLPHSLIAVPAGAFYHCSSLSSIALGENIQEIGSDAFCRRRFVGGDFLYDLCACFGRGDLQDG